MCTKTVTYQVKVNFPLQLVNGILCTFVYSSLRSTNKLTNALNGEGEEVNVCLSCNNKALYMHTTPRLREYRQFYFSNHSFICSLLSVDFYLLRIVANRHKIDSKIRFRSFWSKLQVDLCIMQL